MFRYSFGVSVPFPFLLNFWLNMIEANEINKSTDLGDQVKTFLHKTSGSQSFFQITAGQKWLFKSQDLKKRFSYPHSSCPSWRSIMSWYVAGRFPLFQQIWKSRIFLEKSWKKHHPQKGVGDYPGISWEKCSGFSVGCRSRMIFFMCPKMNSSMLPG